MRLTDNEIRDLPKTHFDISNFDYLIALTNGFHCGILYTTLKLEAL
jgi:hypothetical protein